MHSLNRIYRTIWSEALNAWVAVSELVKSKGKRSCSSVMSVLNIGGVDAATDDLHRHRFKLALLAASCLLTFQVQANPMGGNVVNGSASFNTSGNTLTVTNTPGAIIHWQDFSIQRNEITRFAQQSASSAVLNRVVGGNTSQILGALQSNGRVFLVNPNGIVFGAGSTVDVAGLVATSLNLSDADFLSGRHRFTSDPNAQAISNAGNLTAQSGGEIYLIAPDVENSGIITAPNGEILLAAGSSVELVNSLDPALRVNITAPAGDATNIGQLVASAGRLGLFGTIVRNGGQVSADSATMQGGKIVFRATQRVEAGGTISAQGVGGGEIKVLADMQSGTVQVSGTLDASAPVSGDGGFIDTSAAHLDIGTTAQITANALNGKAGEWLIDPLNVTIGISPSDVGGAFVGGVWTPSASGSFITSGTIQTALNAGTSVTITTVNGGFSEAGDIYVNTSIAKTLGAATTLTLNAEGNINFALGSGISSTTGALSVVLRADADANSTGTVTFAGTNAFSLLGGRVDLYYNPSSYAAPTSYVTPMGATPYTAWMLVNDVGLEVGGTLGLQAMSTNLAGNYALGKLIDATGTTAWNTGAGFSPVGNNITSFTGRFDGMGQTIDGLFVNLPTTNYVGLFGYIGSSNSKVGNVTLTNVNVTGQNSVGGLIGTNYYGSIDNANVGGTVTGWNYVGGLLGDNNYFGSVSNSVSSVNVNASAPSYTGNIGGLVGRSQIYSSITNSSASGNVTATNTVNVGGLAGYNGYNSSITNSSASGIVAGDWSVGGLVGRNGGSIVGSSATGAVSASTVSGYASTVGGLVGYNVWAGYSGSGNFECSWNCWYYSNGNISSSFATGNVTGISDVGGLVGYNNSGGSTIGGGSYASGTVTGSYNIGGLVGNNYSLVDNAWATGTVVGSGVSSSSLGGLAGNNSGTISNSYATGVAVTGDSSLGGLVGLNYGTINNSHVTNGTATGFMDVGGMVGYNNGTISNSYVGDGSFTATRQIGGLVGQYAGGTVTNSFYDINAVTLNAGSLVTRNGLYSTQYATWYNAGALTPLVIGNYLTQDAGLNYQIGTLQNLRDMLAFADNPAYSYILTANIDMTGAAGLYIPYLAATSFDGANFTVSNLNISVPNTGMGFIGINAGTTVSNLVVQDATVTGANAVGSVIGQNNGALSNSHAARITVGLISGSSSVGGLVGNNGFGGSITNSYVSSGAVVASKANIGGLVGGGYGTNTNSFFNIDAVTTNGGNNVTVWGLYNTGGTGQFNDWLNVGTPLTPLVIADYSTSLVLQGDGSYGINSLQGMKDMLGFADDLVAYDFSLTSNIDLATLPGFYVPKLAGSFNGNNFIVSNLNLTLPNFNMGLFGVTKTTSLVNNLNLVNARVNGYSNVGGLAGSNYGNIDNVSVGIDPVNGITAAVGQVGGLVGYNVGASTFTGTGTTYQQVFTGVISNSFVSGGSVSSSGNDVGGLVGWNNLGGIQNNSVTNTSVSGASNVGGLVGLNQATTYLAGSYPNGSISNSFVSGGLVTSTGTVADSRIGGLVGANFSGDISSSGVDLTSVDGGAAFEIGGLVGYNGGRVSSVWNSSNSTSATIWHGTISSSYVNGGLVSSTGNDVGGLVGNNYIALIDSSFVDGVTVIGNLNVGGLVGHDSGEGWGGGVGKISNSYALNTQVTGTASVGGLVGYVAAPITSYGGDNFDAVINSYVDGGTVTSNATLGASAIGIGGLVGSNNHGNISNSYVTNGTVVDGGFASDVGGLVGYNIGSSNSTWNGTTYVSAPHDGIISNSYVSAGTVNGSINVGGLVGNNDGISAIDGGSINSSYAIGVGVGTAATGSASNFGGLVGTNSGAISNSYVSGGTVGAGTSASAYLYAVGGLVGSNLGSIDTSYVTGGAVNGYTTIGGLVGYNDGAISQSYAASGLVSGCCTNAYGLVGYNAVNGNVSDSYWDIDTTGAGVSNGIGFGTGISTNVVGIHSSTPTVDAFTQATYFGFDFTPGTGAWFMVDGNTRPFLQMEYSTNITNSHQLQLIGMNATTLSASYILGANIDMAETATGTGMWSSAGFVPLGDLTTKFTGTFDGLGHTLNSLTINRPTTDYVGLFGYTQGSNLNDVGLVNAGVTGANQVGALVGRNSGNVFNAWATGTVTNTGNYIGGLAGWNTGTVGNVWATSTVTSAGFDVGGLVGISSGTGTISFAYATGAVSGSSTVGGLAGRNEGTISNAYASGAVNGSSIVGGLVGEIWNGAVSNAYATGAVSGSSTVGGLVGNNYLGTVNAVYFDIDTTGQISAFSADNNSQSAGGLTSAQMQQQSSFADFDFTSTWRIYNGHTAPLLKSFLTPVTVTASGITGNFSNTYDGTAFSPALGVVTYSDPTAAGLLNESTPFGGAINVGTYEMLWSGQQGYDVSYSAGGMLTITPKVISLSGTKIYDGTAVFAGETNLFAVTGVGAETLILTGNASTADKKVGNTDLLSEASLGLTDGTNGGVASNYTLIGVGLTGVISITPLALTGTSIAAVTATYGTPAAAGAVTFGNIISGDVVNSTAGIDGQTFSSSGNLNAGSYTQTASTTLGGLNAGNYSFAGFTSSANYSVGQLALTGAAIAAVNTTYGTPAANGAVTFTNIQGTDVVTPATATTVSPTFSTSGNLNAGSYAQTVSGTLAAVNDNANYSFAGFTSTPNYTVGQLALTIGATGVNRVYDATTNATVTLNDNRFAGDVLGTTYSTAAFADKNVGLGKTVNVSGLTLSGTDAANYSFNTSATTSADISQAALSISGLTANNKTYDATTAATVNTAGASYTGLIAGDAVVVNASGVFADKNAGSGKTVALTSGYSGADVGNYLITDQLTTTANISQAVLTIGATGVNRVYDGTAGATVTLADNRLGTDVLNTAYSTAAFLDKNAALGKTVNVSGITLGGTDAGNYTFNTAAATTANITQLGSVSWVGGSGTSWAYAANWTGGALPDGTNVLGVIIPNGKTVVFDSSVGPTTLNSLVNNGSLTIADGSSLTVSSSLTNTSNFTLNVAGTLNTGTATNTGTINIADGASPTFTAISLDNQGVINLGNGISTLDVSGTLNNQVAINSVGTAGSRTLNAKTLLNGGMISMAYPMTVAGVSYAAGTTLSDTTSAPPEYEQIARDITNIALNTDVDTSEVDGLTDEERKKKAEQALDDGETAVVEAGGQFDHLPVCQ